ncbi:MarR family winged helix-turn-helix transcriptional regulator [Liquorilactobacillus satsumensis]|uniref:MarR family winged helix-turn-helix transcriptional regulator n=1 Tax=Liquorilactobacillus TaxID=2767888 RepID=UPI000B18FB7C|nr:MarR family winged helix-turn-helix transcriptional regulator [Liquorilactobacillus satsumensis]MCP9329212.1 winged helix-turn-helix transcriptional regulator [Liquorilactobacillus satsumensis]
MNNIKINQLGRYVGIIQRASMTALNHRLNLPGLTASNANLLLFVNEHQKVTAKMVATQLAINKGLVSREFTILTNNGYIKKSINLNDRRNTWIVLTVKGQNACDEISQLVTSWWQEQLKKANCQNQQVLYSELNKLAASIIGTSLKS